MDSRRVGVAWNRNRARNVNFEDSDVVAIFRKEGLELSKVDLQRPLVEQGHFDCIIHKVVDVFFDSVEERSIAIQHAQEYLLRNSSCLMLNPMTNTEVLHDRRRLFPFIQKALEHENDFYIPAFVEIDTKDTSKIAETLSRANITYPILCKPIIGTEHLMTVVFNEAGLGDMPAHCVAQTFVNHCATLYKTYMMSDTQWQFARKSVADLQPGPHPTVQFDSLNVCEPNKQHILHSKGELRPLPSKDETRMREVAKRLRRAVGMDLIGIDFIYDVRRNKYAVIDINEFPGFKGVEGFHRHLARFIAERVGPAKHSLILDAGLMMKEGIVAGSTADNPLVVR